MIEFAIITLLYWHLFHHIQRTANSERTTTTQNGGEMCVVSVSCAQDVDGNSESN